MACPSSAERRQTKSVVNTHAHSCGAIDAVGMQKWEYMVIPLEAAGGLKKKSAGLEPERLNELGAEGWEAVGLSLKRGDLVAWPVVLLKRPVH
jgi:hypothetical protein